MAAAGDLDGQRPDRSKHFVDALERGVELLGPDERLRERQMRMMVVVEPQAVRRVRRERRIQVDRALADVRRQQEGDIKREQVHLQLPTSNSQLPKIASGVD